MGWLVALVVLILLGCLPLGIRGFYDTSGVRAELIVGPAKIPVYPAKKKKKKKKTPEKKAETTAEKKEAKEKTKGGSWTDFLPFISLIVDFLGEFRRKLRIRHLELYLCMAGGDPCDLAINYGKAWAYVGNVMPLLERVFVIKKRNIQIDCDFTQSETTVYVRADVTITLARLLGLVFKYGWRALKEYFQIINKRNGGASK